MNLTYCPFYPERKVNILRWQTKNKIKRNAIAYGFLSIPLAILTVFVFYPMFRGIYISFMEYEILKRPVIGGPIDFLINFLRNVPNSPNFFLAAVLFILTIAAAIHLFRKKSISNKLAVTLTIVLLIITLVPVWGTVNQSFKEINYVLEEDRELPNKKAELFTKMLDKKYSSGRFKDEDVEIITEKIDDNTSRVIVKKSIWIGLGHYRRIIKNKEFAQWVQNNNWYLFLVGLTVLMIGSLLFLPEKLKARSKNLDIAYKVLTALVAVALVYITWPRMFHDRMWLFYEGLSNSLKYLMVVIPLQFFAIILAVLVNQKIKGVKFFRTLFYVPVITGIIIIGYCWKWVFNPDGLLNSLLQMAHILEAGEKIYWLSDPSIALWAVMFVTFWRGLGYYMVIYMAGLQNIPEDIVEAATIDGASKLQMVLRIYLPLLRNTIMLCTILSTMAALKIFEELFVLTSGQADTTTMVYLIYDKAFAGTEFKFGYSAALAVILSIIIGFFTVLNFKVNKGDGRHA